MNILKRWKAKRERAEFDRGVCWASYELRAGKSHDEIESTVKCGMEFHTTSFDYGALSVVRARRKTLSQ